MPIATSDPYHKTRRLADEIRGDDSDLVERLTDLGMLQGRVVAPYGKPVLTRTRRGSFYPPGMRRELPWPELVQQGLVQVVDAEHAFSSSYTAITPQMGVYNPEEWANEWLRQLERSMGVNRRTLFLVAPGMREQLVTWLQDSGYRYLDQETGIGDWMTVVAPDNESVEQVLDAAATRRSWQRVTAESALRGAGQWSDNHALWDFDTGPIESAGTKWTISMLNKRVQKAITKAFAGERVLFVTKGDHFQTDERRIAHASMQGADDAVQLTDDLLLPRWRFRDGQPGGWLALAPREELAERSTWPGDRPTVLETSPACDDWLRVPFPTVSACEETEEATA